MDGGTTILRNAHVIDPAQGIDRVCDVSIADGKIAAVGEVPPSPGAESIDLAGSYVTPGWVDIHVHAFGTLGFCDVDSIGIYQGVTTFVDAGGTGIECLDEFVAILKGSLTEFYAGPIIQPFGIITTDKKGRELSDVPVPRWIEWVKANPGVLRYVKSAAYGLETSGPISVSKGIAEMLRLPLYIHIGEIAADKDLPPTAEDAFRVAQAGDIITHIYHNNPGRVLDKQGKVLPYVWEAERRGVLFDIGFGGYNFSWDVAEKGFAQGLFPHFLSSDLQQFNVINPVHSLANVMSIFLKLGLSLHDVIEDVTSRPAKALSLTDRAGSLRVGQPADITVFRIDNAERQLLDCYQQKRKVENHIVPLMAFKRGQKVICDIKRAHDERNWFMQVAEERLPPAAERLTSAQFEFLRAFAQALSTVPWEPYVESGLDVDAVYAVHRAFHKVQRAHGLSLRDAMTAVFDCFLENPFPMQIGVFLIRLERSFVLQRLGKVAGLRTLAA